MRIQFAGAVVEVEPSSDAIRRSVLPRKEVCHDTIKEIMQIGVGMPDRKAFADFSHALLGLPTTNSADGTVTYVRVDGYRHRLAARTAAAPVLHYIGFDVGGPDALAE